MSQAVRVGDLCSCICPCHDSPVSTIGTFVTGSPDTLINGKASVRVGDIAVCTCGHPTICVGGSPDVITNGRKQARVGDPVSSCPVGTIITGSNDTLVN